MFGYDSGLRDWDCWAEFSDMWATKEENCIWYVVVEGKGGGTDLGGAIYATCILLALPIVRAGLKDNSEYALFARGD